MNRIHNIIKILQNNFRTATRYEPLDYRNLALLAHFGHMYDPLTFPEAQPPALETLRPYKVPWSLFSLHVCHAAVPNSQIMNVLNGSVVALCHVSESDILVGDNILVIIRFHVTHCKYVQFLYILEK